PSRYRATRKRVPRLTSGFHPFFRERRDGLPSVTPFRMKLRLAHLATIFTLLSSLLAAQTSPSFDPKEIVAAAAGRGEQLIAALQRHTYYTELTIETVGPADTITGKLYRFSEIYYDSSGNRQERIIENKSTLPEDIHLGANTIKNILSIYQFIITPEIAKQYDFNYVGRERIDELNTYVFDVSPVIKIPDPRKNTGRYLKGRVWIDDRDLQVVKVSGQALPGPSENRTPKFETYFQSYDKYWFPAYTSADEIIKVDKASYRALIKAHMTNYKKANK